MENKIKILSNTIVNYSIKVRKDERVLINCDSIKAINFIKNLIKDIYKVGGVPFVKINHSNINALLNEYANHIRIKEIGKMAEYEANNFDCFINIRYNINDYENNKIAHDVITAIKTVTKNAKNIIVNQKKWVLLNYPSELDAFKAKMPIDHFYNYAFKVMCIDYSKIRCMVEPLKRLMEKTDKVRIISPKTAITFSIKNMPVIPCCGECNIPDGEIYTAPIKDSVNGVITFNTPCPYDGNIYHDVSLTLKNGRIIKCGCNEDSDKLKKIFNIDEGAKYIGEFLIGLNP